MAGMAVNAGRTPEGALEAAPAGEMSALQAGARVWQAATLLVCSAGVTRSGVAVNPEGANRSKAGHGCGRWQAGEMPGVNVTVVVAGNCRVAPTYKTKHELDGTQ